MRAVVDERSSYRELPSQKFCKGGIRGVGPPSPPPSLPSKKWGGVFPNLPGGGGVGTTNWGGGG